VKSAAGERSSRPRTKIIKQLIKKSGKLTIDPKVATGAE